MSQHRAPSPRPASLMERLNRTHGHAGSTPFDAPPADAPAIQPAPPLRVPPLADTHGAAYSRSAFRARASAALTVATAFGLFALGVQHDNTRAAAQPAPQGSASPTR